MILGFLNMFLLNLTSINFECYKNSINEKQIVLNHPTNIEEALGETQTSRSSIFSKKPLGSYIGAIREGLERA